MKLDWTIVKQILLAIESKPRPAANINFRGFPHPIQASVGYHMDLLHKSGFIEMTDGGARYSQAGSQEIFVAVARNMTLKGHDLLAMLKNDLILKRLTKFSEGQAEPVVLEIVTWITEEAREVLLSKD